MGPCVGIDLGTTNSLVGTVRSGGLELFADDHGRELLPSVVGTDETGTLLVGRAARNRRLIDPAGTVVSIKRKMGVDTSVLVGTRQLSPPEVSALILGSLLDRAEAKLGTRPERAVITVPAYFNDAQRQATRDAGLIAGMAVERLVNEPTAAALTYQTGAEECVMVYDFGGGTFDVSVLERDEGFLEVRASRGDTTLGGDDIDRALVALVLDRLGRDREVIERSMSAMVRLTDAVERAKIGLTERSEVSLFDPYLAGEGASAVHLDMTLTRPDLETVARPFIERTLACIDEALRDAGVSARGLDRVLLVGGSSKMPLVERMVAEHLGRPALVDPNADRAVALGASLLAGRIAGEDVAEVLVDITPHTLAVGACDFDEPLFGRGDGDLLAVELIPRDTVVPTERTKTLFTMFDHQDTVELPVVQGEGPRVADNTWLGNVVVRNLPPSPAHSPVEVRFRLDLSGVLEVSATHLPSAQSQSVVIADSPYRLSTQRREAARSAVEALRAGTLNTAAAMVSESDLELARAMIARAERALERAEDAGAASRARSAMESLASATRERSPETLNLIDALSDALLDLM